MNLRKNKRFLEENQEKTKRKDIPDAKNWPDALFSCFMFGYSGEIGKIREF